MSMVSLTVCVSRASCTFCGSARPAASAMDHSAPCIAAALRSEACTCAGFSSDARTASRVCAYSRRVVRSRAASSPGRYPARKYVVPIALASLTTNARRASKRVVAKENENPRISAVRTKMAPYATSNGCASGPASSAANRRRAAAPRTTHPQFTRVTVIHNTMSGAEYVSQYITGRRCFSTRPVRAHRPDSDRPGLRSQGTCVSPAARKPPSPVRVDRLGTSIVARVIGLDAHRAKTPGHLHPRAGLVVRILPLVTFAEAERASVPPRHGLEPVAGLVVDLVPPHPLNLLLERGQIRRVARPAIHLDRGHEQLRLRPPQLGQARPVQVDRRGHRADGRSVQCETAARVIESVGERVVN